MSAALQSVDLGADGGPAPVPGSATSQQPAPTQDENGRDVMYSQQQQRSNNKVAAPSTSSNGEAAVNVQVGTAAYSQIDVQPCDTAGGPNFYSISAQSAHSGHTSVRRRFNDLVALHENIKVTFRGCVIPFRPGKTVANSTAVRHHKDTFLRDRAYAIKCYLVKVAHHPEIKESTVLKQFMESTEILRTSVVWSQEQPHRSSALGGFVKSMRKMAGIEARIPTPSQVENGNGKTEHDLVRQMAETRINRKKLHESADEEEKSLLDLGDALPDMLKANQAFAAAAASVIDSAKALIESHADNGAGLQQLWSFEKETELAAQHKLSEQTLDVLAACVDTFGRCISNTTSITKQMAILDPANDHAFMLPRVEKAMAARIDSLVVLEALKRQQSVIDAQYKQLLAKESNGTMSNTDVRKMNRARSEVDQVEQAKAAGERTHALLQRRNRRDVAWYRAGREQQFSAMVLQFAEAQATLQASLGDLWLGMASRTGAVKQAYGDDLEGVVLSDLGMRTSESAAFVEPEPEENAIAADTAVSGGAVPPEHAEQAEGADA